MITKVLFNNSGSVIMCINDSNIDLSGNLYVEVEIPSGKHIERIDITGEHPVPIFTDIPKSESDIKIEQLQTQIEATQEALNFLMFTNT